MKKSVAYELTRLTALSKCVPTSVGAMAFALQVSVSVINNGPVRGGGFPGNRVLAPKNMDVSWLVGNFV